MTCLCIKPTGVSAWCGEFNRHRSLKTKFSGFEHRSRTAFADTLQDFIAIIDDGSSRRYVFTPRISIPGIYAFSGVRVGEGEPGAEMLPCYSDIPFSFSCSVQFWS